MTIAIIIAVYILGVFAARWCYYKFTDDSDGRMPFAIVFFVCVWSWLFVFSCALYLFTGKYWKDEKN